MDCNKIITYLIMVISSFMAMKHVYKLEWIESIYTDNVPWGKQLYMDNYMG